MPYTIPNMSSDNLQTTLTDLLQSGTQSNPALNELLNDYATYHLVLVILGGIFTLAFIALGIFCWRKFKAVPKTDAGKWTFEKKTFFSFGILATITSMLMVLIVVANVSNVVESRRGFAGTLSMISAPVGTPKAELHQSFNAWLQSGDTQMPTTVQDRINERLSWQLPKAIISSILLVTFVAASVRIWRDLIKRSRDQKTKHGRKQKVLLVLGTLTVIACLPLMLMVIGNTQAVVAPMALTMLFG